MEKRTKVVTVNAPIPTQPHLETDHRPTSFGTGPFALLPIDLVGAIFNHITNIHDILTLSLVSKLWSRTLSSTSLARARPHFTVEWDFPFQSNQAARDAAKIIGHMTELRVGRDVAVHEPNQVVEFAKQLTEETRKAVVVWETTMAPLWPDVVAHDVWKNFFTAQQLGSLVCNYAGRIINNFPSLDGFSNLRVLSLANGTYSTPLQPLRLPKTLISLHLDFVRELTSIDFDGTSSLKILDLSHMERDLGLVKGLLFPSLEKLSVRRMTQALCWNEENLIQRFPNLRELVIDNMAFTSDSSDLMWPHIHRVAVWYIKNERNNCISGIQQLVNACSASIEDFHTGYISECATELVLKCPLLRHVHIGTMQTPFPVHFHQCQALQSCSIYPIDPPLRQEYFPALKMITTYCVELSKVIQIESLRFIRLRDEQGDGIKTTREYLIGHPPHRQVVVVSHIVRLRVFSFHYFNNKLSEIEEVEKFVACMFDQPHSSSDLVDGNWTPFRFSECAILTNVHNYSDIDRANALFIFIEAL